MRSNSSCSHTWGPVHPEDLLEVLELRLGLRLPHLAQDPPDPAAVVADQGDEHLARNVAPHDQHVGLVEPGRVQELPPAPLGAVDVGRVVERNLAHSAPPVPS